MKKFSICLDGAPGELFNNLLDNLKNDYHISRSEARSALFKALTTKSVTDAIEREILTVLGIGSDDNGEPDTQRCAYCAPDGECQKLYEYDLYPVKCWARGNQPGCDYYCAPADYCAAADEEIEPDEFKHYILSKVGMAQARSHSGSGEGKQSGNRLSARIVYL